MSMKERRGQMRCVKDIDMRCGLLNGNVVRTATLRNFSGSGLFFETAVQMVPGTYIVIRSTNANEARGAASGSAGLQYTLDANDPGVCSLFRSHSVAKVKRCERLEGHYDSPHYGVAAEIEMLAE